MPTRSDFQRISDLRLDDAKALYGQGRYDGALYMAGYVVETALKARICKILEDDYPLSGEYKPFKTHNFDQLVFLGGLRTKLNQEKRVNTNFAANWSIVTKWTESDRYNLPVATKVDVENMLNALEDKNDGVLTWIKNLW